MNLKCHSNGVLIEQEREAREAYASNPSRTTLEQIRAIVQRLLGKRQGSEVEGRQRSISRIIVDLVPLLPGGENGGAKLVALELIQRMARRTPETKFLLLTLQRTFDELAGFNQPNIEPVLVDNGALLAPSKNRFRRFLSRPGKIFTGRRSLVRYLQGSVLFCPFTAPSLAVSGVPTVCLIHDLQYADYPQYFEESDRSQRHRNFAAACRQADRLICVSNFVRRRVLEASTLPDGKVTTVYTQLAHRFSTAPEICRSTLADLQLTPGRYFFYPANFWKHKNHEMLLTAMGLLVRRCPGSDIKLVCTGAGTERATFLKSAAERMGLKHQVVFPGYVSDSEFSVLMHNCLALIYPSLYEGFGMPVIEAQAIGKPVLCGNVTSLPEISGGAALIFDPKLPESIVEAIQRIESDLQLRQELSRSGLANARRFADADTMANEYLTVLAEAVQNRSPN
jgi:glycosyltransferase involved in cell wall biosynthesis